MDKEELIEAARVAFTEAWEAEDRRIENWDRDSRGRHTRSRAGIIAALAVFEASLQNEPTDAQVIAALLAFFDYENKAPVGNARELSYWGPSADRMRAALRAAAADEQESKPWHSADLGEVWILSFEDDRDDMPYHVIENGCFESYIDTIPIESDYITGARRIWPEEVVPMAQQEAVERIIGHQPRTVTEAMNGGTR